jgi:hypothetical protein
MLLYADASFFQILEGEESTVDSLYRRIHRDKRHAHVTLIVREPIARRAFGDWTMGYAHATREELAKVQGLNDFFGKGSVLECVTYSRAKKLLTAFAEGSWRSRLSGREHRDVVAA